MALVGDVNSGAATGDGLCHRRPCFGAFRFPFARRHGGGVPAGRVVACAGPATAAERSLIQPPGDTAITRIR